MHDEGRPHQEEDQILALAKAFEAMVEAGDSRFFDHDDLEMLIEHYLERGSVRKAQQVHHYASGLYPESLSLQLREAQILASNGKHVQAIPRLKNLLSFEPQNEEIHLTLANIYSQMHEHTLALQHFNAVLEFADEELKKDIYIDVALEHENMGEWKQAVRILLKALKEDPSNETALYELAFCLDKEGRIQEAAEFYTQYLDDHPYSFAAWYNLGNAHQRLGKYKEAVNAYDFAIAIEDSFAPAYHQKAEALTALERFGDALEVHRETLLIDAPQPSTFCYMGECLEHLGNLDEAEQYYMQCLELDAHFLEAHVGLGVLDDLREDWNAALEHFAQALLLHPHHEDTLLMMATVLKKLGRHEDADTCLVQLLERNPKHLEAWEERVDNMQILEAHEEALNLLDNAFEHVPPTSTSLGYKQFVSLFALRMDGEALRLLDHLLMSDYDGMNRLLETYPGLLDDPRVASRYARMKP
ncbi:MAG: tetratricopeptide repeat protein [Bacteroidetes bacterium]|nr:tetratricopeptide repeat protein [Bacteroidota bacterium]